MIHKSEDIVDVIEQALTMAMSGKSDRVGSMCLCVFKVQIDITDDDLNKPISLLEYPKVNNNQINEITEQIKSSKRPLILIGSELSLLMHRVFLVI